MERFTPINIWRPFPTPKSLEELVVCSRAPLLVVEEVGEVRHIETLATNRAAVWQEASYAFWRHTPVGGISYFGYMFVMLGCLLVSSAMRTSGS